MRLLYAGQPPQPSAPPVPLQLPPPGQVPRERKAAPGSGPVVVEGVGLLWIGWLSLVDAPSFAGTVVTFFSVCGLDVFRAFKYRPQALHIVAPVGDLRQSGVRVVPQLLFRCQKASGSKALLRLWGAAIPASLARSRSRSVVDIRTFARCRTPI